MTGGIEVALAIGATWDIGRAIARDLAGGGYAVQLAGRDTARLEREARDIRVRTGAAAALHCRDALRDDGGASLLAALDPLPEVAACVVGLPGGQAESRQDAAAAKRVTRTDYVGPALLTRALAGRFGRRGSGVPVGAGSVAGGRGRAANYVDGS